MTKKSGLLLIASFFTLLFITSCATTYHGYVMRGSILESTGKDVYLCIGSKDGAKTGDEFTVYKNVKTVVDTKQASKDVWKKEQTGTVKILEIVNDHYAKGVITSGKADINSIVEMK